MQVFKVFFKVLRGYINIIIMYVCIFLSVVMGVIVPQLTKDAKQKGYTQSKCDIAVFDYDESELSEQITEYLGTIHKIKKIKDDTKETIQDELYAMNIDSVLRFKEGFAEAFENGNGAEYIEVINVPDTTTAILFEQSLNSYLSVVNTYIQAGFEGTEAAQKAEEASEATVDVQFAEEDASKAMSGVHYFYVYLPWIFIAMCVSALTGVVLAFDKKVIRERIECSSYKFTKMNLELVLAVLAVGFVICGVCNIAAMIAFKEDIFSTSGIWYVMNSFCIMLVSLAITFMVSKLTDKPQVISLFANIVGLGMAFLSGVFVPLELLSDTVIKIAHFLPVYWNVKAIHLIDEYKSSDLGTLVSYMGIQILFAIAIVCVGMVIARRKRVS